MGIAEAKVYLANRLRRVSQAVKRELKPIPHLSLQTKDQVVLDEVDALLLRRVSETNSLTEAAKLLGISYRNAWGRIKKAEGESGKRILRTHTGGAAGGGSILTPEGFALFKEYRSARKYLFNALDERESAGNVRYKLSARNSVGAKVTEIQRGDITSLIRMTTASPVKLTSIISNEAVDDLGLREGDRVEAVIKSTEVMVAKALPPQKVKWKPSS
jgi:molybdate transport system regulatory protein